MCVGRDSGVWDSQRSPLTRRGLLIQFVDFQIAKVFLREIYLATKIQCIGAPGGHQSGTVNFFSALSSENCGQYTNDKYIYIYIF